MLHRSRKLLYIFARTLKEIVVLNLDNGTLGPSIALSHPSKRKLMLVGRDHLLVHQMGAYHLIFLPSHEYVVLENFQNVWADETSEWMFTIGKAPGDDYETSTIMAISACQPSNRKELRIRLDQGPSTYKMKFFLSYGVLVLVSFYGHLYLAKFDEVRGFGATESIWQDTRWLREGYPSVVCMNPFTRANLYIQLTLPGQIIFASFEVKAEGIFYSSDFLVDSSLVIYAQTFDKEMLYLIDSGLRVRVYDKATKHLTLLGDFNHLLNNVKTAPEWVIAKGYWRPLSVFHSGG